MPHLLLVAVMAIAPFSVPDDSLAARIAARIAALPGARAGVAFIDLERPDSVFLDADSSFHAASTMKVPVMIELFRQLDAGHLSLDQPILLVNSFGSIADGSPFSTSPADDSDSSVYALVGTRVTIRLLIERMIVRSSNLATNAVIALVGAPHITLTMRSLGASHIQVLRGVEDGKAFERGMNNTTTARDLAVIMAAIEQNRAASVASCRDMRHLLLGQEFNDRIPAGLPAGILVAHKTGDITAVMHDAAIVYPRERRPYVLVVLTRGIPDSAMARALIADISRMVYDHVVRSSPRVSGARAPSPTGTTKPGERILHVLRHLTPLLGSENLLGGLERLLEIVSPFRELGAQRAEQEAGVRILSRLLDHRADLGAERVGLCPERIGDELERRQLRLAQLERVLESDDLTDGVGHETLESRTHVAAARAGTSAVSTS
ncbi:MAG: class A beta-lactamase-related serine hydrolase [Gemmatimonadota bacterium]|nr:class A beta-lactamase-related serine hydrolase [Gemmatimonadota bacterium]